jgi:hypothetical protein
MFHTLEALWAGLGCRGSHEPRPKLRTHDYGFVSFISEIVDYPLNRFRRIANVVVSGEGVLSDE